MSDSLLPWNSVCRARRNQACEVSVDELDRTSVSSLDPDCECDSELIDVSVCNYGHQVSFIQVNNNYRTRPVITLLGVRLNNIYESYNAIIGFSKGMEPLLAIVNSAFENISMCGAIVAYNEVPPHDSCDHVV